MTKENQSLQILYLILLIAAIFLFSISGYGLAPWFFIALFLAGLVFIFMKKKHHTLILANLLILFAGSIPLFSFIFNQDLLLHHQLYFLLRYALFSFLLFLLLYIFYQMEQTAKELEGLRKYKDVLEDLQNVTGLLLTKEQFEVQKRLILQGAKRRGETCMILEIEILSSKKDPAFYALQQTVETSLLATIQTNYDLIYRKTQKLYIVLLQNIDESDITKVQQRFLEHLQQSLVHPEKWIRLQGFRAMEE